MPEVTQRIKLQPTSPRWLSKEVSLGLCFLEHTKRSKKTPQGYFLLVAQHPTKDTGNRKPVFFTKRASQ